MITNIQTNRYCTSRGPFLKPTFFPNRPQLILNRVRLIWDGFVCRVCSNYDKRPAKVCQDLPRIRQAPPKGMTAIYRLAPTTRMISKHSTDPNGGAAVSRLRHNGVSGSFLDGPMVKGSFFQLILGTPAARKLGASEYLEALFRPVGAPRPDFLDFLVHRGGVPK